MLTNFDYYNFTAFQLQLLCFLLYFNDSPLPSRSPRQRPYAQRAIVLYSRIKPRNTHNIMTMLSNSLSQFQGCPALCWPNDPPVAQMRSVRLSCSRVPRTALVTLILQRPQQTDKPAQPAALPPSPPRLCWGVPPQRQQYALVRPQLQRHALLCPRPKKLRWRAPPHLELQGRMIFEHPDSTVRETS